MRIGYCKYCGQSMTLETEQDGPQELLDEKATWNCKCTEAKVQRERTERLERVYEYIDNLFADQKTAELFKGTAEAVVEYRIAKAVVTDTEWKYSIFKDSDGDIHIDRQKSVKEETSF